MLLYLLLVVDIIERNQQKQTAYQAAATHRRRRFYRPVHHIICRYQRACVRYGYSNYCWPRKICTN